MFLIENDRIGLTQYTHDDDYDMFLCWQDRDTQKGYNGIFDQSFDDFRVHDIDRFKFWVTVVDKSSNTKVGTLRLGLDETCPDLAIWIYPQYRNRGYGKASFALALKYLFSNYPHNELSAGCFEDNHNSRRILEQLGFVRVPEKDETEENCFTGEPTVQQEYRLNRTDFLNFIE